MKASDISDEQFMTALTPDGPTFVDELSERLGYPTKVVLAKAKTMITRRKTVDGCYCGCSGAFREIKPNPIAEVVKQFLDRVI